MSSRLLDRHRRHFYATKTAFSWRGLGRGVLRWGGMLGGGVAGGIGGAAIGTAMGLPTGPGAAITGGYSGLAGGLAGGAAGEALGTGLGNAIFGPEQQQQPQQPQPPAAVPRRPAPIGGPTVHTAASLRPDNFLDQLDRRLASPERQLELYKLARRLEGRPELPALLRKQAFVMPLARGALSLAGKGVSAVGKAIGGKSTGQALGPAVPSASGTAKAIPAAQAAGAPLMPAKAGPATTGVGSSLQTLGGKMQRPANMARGAANQAAKVEAAGIAKLQQAVPGVTDPGAVLKAYGGNADAALAHIAQHKGDWRAAYSAANSAQTGIAEAGKGFMGRHGGTLANVGGMGALIGLPMMMGGGEMPQQQGFEHQGSFADRVVGRVKQAARWTERLPDVQLGAAGDGALAVPTPERVNAMMGRTARDAAAVRAAVGTPLGSTPEKLSPQAANLMRESNQLVQASNLRRVAKDDVRAAAGGADPLAASAGRRAAMDPAAYQQDLKARLRLKHDYPGPTKVAPGPGNSVPVPPRPTAAPAPLSGGRPSLKQVGIGAGVGAGVGLAGYGLSRLMGGGQPKQAGSPQYGVVDDVGSILAGPVGGAIQAPSGHRLEGAGRGLVFGLGMMGTGHAAGSLGHNVGAAIGGPRARILGQLVGALGGNALGYVGARNALGAPSWKQAAEHTVGDDVGSILFGPLGGAVQAPTGHRWEGAGRGLAIGVGMHAGTRSGSRVAPHLARLAGKLPGRLGLGAGTLAAGTSPVLGAVGGVTAARALLGNPSWATTVPKQANVALAPAVGMLAGGIVGGATDKGVAHGALAGGMAGLGARVGHKSVGKAYKRFGGADLETRRHLKLMGGLGGAAVGGSVGSAAARELPLKKKGGAAHAIPFGKAAFLQGLQDTWNGLEPHHKAMTIGGGALALGALGNQFRPRDGGQAPTLLNAAAGLGGLGLAGYGLSGGQPDRIMTGVRGLLGGPGAPGASTTSPVAGPASQAPPPALSRYLGPDGKPNFQALVKAPDDELKKNLALLSPQEVGTLRTQLASFRPSWTQRVGARAMGIDVDAQRERFGRLLG